VRGVSPEEADILSILITRPEDAGVCDDELCRDIEEQSSGLGTCSTLERDGRARFWPCRVSTLNHGEITYAGRLAMKLRSLV